MDHAQSLEEQHRLQAIQLAHQRVKADATVDELLEEAHKLLAFVKGGHKVAIPGKDEKPAS